MHESYELNSPFMEKKKMKSTVYPYMNLPLNIKTKVHKTFKS